MFQAGNYSATLHYLKAVSDLGAAAAKADGRAVVDRMKAMPTDDDCFGNGSIRVDGRKLHPSYLFRVKSPTESTQEGRLQACRHHAGRSGIRPLNEGGCPLVPADRRAARAPAASRAPAIKHPNHPQVAPSCPLPTRFTTVS
jgi:branched-chain amino acid transport system substrate-binding protein